MINRLRIWWAIQSWIWGERISRQVLIWIAQIEIRLLAYRAVNNMDGKQRASYRRGVPR